MGVNRTKMTVDVAVGRGVSVATVGVIVGLGVKEGIEAAVCVLAASTVWAIKVPTAPGSIVGTDGVASAGAHAMINASAVTQTNNFVLRVDVIISSSTSEGDQDGNLLLFFNNDRGVWIAQFAFHDEDHDVCAFLVGGDSIEVNIKLFVRF